MKRGEMGRGGCMGKQEQTDNCICDSQYRIQSVFSCPAWGIRVVDHGEY